VDERPIVHAGQISRITCEGCSFLLPIRQIRRKRCEHLGQVATAKDTATLLAGIQAEGRCSSIPQASAGDRSVLLLLTRSGIFAGGYSRSRGIGRFNCRGACAEAIVFHGFGLLLVCLRLVRL
jgi:hypothetical protein